MKFIKMLVAMSLLVSGGLLAGCDDDDDTSPMGPAAETNVYDAAADLPNYSSLVAAIDKAGLTATLQSASATYTVFAPDNDAFAALLTAIGASSLDDVTAEQLTPILLYHVLDTTVDATAATAAATSNASVSGLGGSLDLALNGGNIEIDGTATVEGPNAVVTDNGIIHGISAVLLPSATDVVVSDSRFSNLAAALTAADTDASSPMLVNTLDGAGTFTVFAPTDDAFAALVGALSGSASTGITGLGDFAPYQLIPVLKYHVLGSTVLADAALAAATNGDAVTTLGGSLQLGLSGGNIQLDGGATVQIANLFTSNGVIHVIDQVLVPSITDVVTTAPEFSSLVGAVLAADGAAGTSPKVAAALDAPAASGAYTVFAPDNAAFAALGAAPSGQALTDVLLYHVLNEGTAIYAADALGLPSPTPFDTLLGSAPVNQVTAAGGSGVTVDDAGTSAAANVNAANYFTSNGVIHKVDKVLIPGTN